MKLETAACAIASLGITAWALAGDGGKVKIPDEPARIAIQVATKGAPAAAERLVTVRLTPAEGIHINRYPKMRLKVDAQKGLATQAEAAVGDDEAPPPDKIEGNYFKTVDPIELPLRLDPAAGTGAYELRGQLTYYYCVKASGFCAPKRVPVTIPISAR